MEIRIDRAGTLEGLTLLVNQVTGIPGIKGLLILACDANGFTPAAVDPLFFSQDLPIFGGIFPELIYGREKCSKGSIVAGFYQDINVAVIPNLSAESALYDSFIEANFSADNLPETMFLLVDGLSKRISALVEALFNSFGVELNYLGGGAGSLSFIQKPCLFTNHGLIEDSALLVGTGIVSGIGIRHGWSEVVDAFTVTESTKNEIISLDWKPAYKVYKEAVETHSGQKFRDDNFFELAKRYPFGIHKIGVENVVRDPMKRGLNNSLICVGEVLENMIVDILSGNHQSLITAAVQAREEAEQSFQDKEGAIKTIFIAESVSRVLFLEEDFQEELDAVSHGGVKTIGIITLGELANTGRDYLEFYNKAVVVGLLDQ